MTSGPAGGERFGVPNSGTPPAIGDYICGQFEQGAPLNSLVALLPPGDPGYVAQPGPSVAPGPVHQCGTFVSYRPADSTRSGELVIGSTTYATSSGNPGPFRQVISPGVTPGSQVCLDGTIANSATTANLLTDFTVAPAPAAAASPAASTSAPAPTLTSAPTTPTAQPVTTPQPQASVFGVGLALIASAALALVGFPIARSTCAQALVETRSLATLAIVLLIIVVGVVVLYVARAQEPPTRGFTLSSPTPTATAAIATATPAATSPATT